MASWNVRRVGAWLACAALLAGCGGGGGGSGGTDDPTGGPRLPPAASVTDDFPTGERQALGAAEYLPYASNGVWVYARSEPEGPKTGEVTVRSTPLGNDRYAVSETADGDTTLTVHSWTDRGWEISMQQVLDLPESTATLLSGLLVYPARFPGPYQTSTQVRRGNVGLDLDGDGIYEGIEVTIQQSAYSDTLVTGPAGPVPAQRVSTTITTRVMPSDTRFADQWGEYEKIEYLVEGVGPVRVEFNLYLSGDGVPENEVWTLESVTIDGVDPFASGRFPVTREVSLPNEDVVSDRARGVYYASVPATDPLRGNRIATIDAGTGAVSLSAPVGSSPGAMALSADGQSLFVALDGSGELLQLRLPGLAEVARHRLPYSPIYGQLLAETIAPSPTEPGTVAISLLRPGVSPGHGGVVLLRDGALQPRMTQEHTGSNLVVFDVAGTSVYGYNSDTTEYGLRRLAVLPDGLVEETVVSAGGHAYITALDRIDDLLVFGKRVYGTDLLARGTLTGGQYCRGLSPSRIACQNDDLGAIQSVLVFETDTFTQVATLPWRNRDPYESAVLEPGTTGQVALRDGISHPARRTAERLILLSHPSLP